MSSEQLIKILYNPSSINSVEAHDALPGDDHNGRDAADDEVFALIIGLTRESRGQQAVFQELIALKRKLTRPLACANRLILIERFTGLVKHLAARFTNSMDIFQSAIQLVTLFKNQVEASPQPHGPTLRAEWVELERVIYLLSTWEGQLDYFWSEAH